MPETTSTPLQLTSEELARRHVRLAIDDLRAAIKNVDNAGAKVSTVAGAESTSNNLAQLQGLAASVLHQLETLRERPWLDLLATEREALMRRAARG